jgi:hypothetical protein
MKVRFFAGYDFTPQMLAGSSLVRDAYANGVTMGSDLRGVAGRQPGFLVWALADPSGAPLQRVQVIKGYLDNGEHRERIYDAACSDGLAADPATGLCPDNGAAVNLADCSISTGAGASELKAIWYDPDFDPAQEAFYYLRVLENPTCRWSTYDALRLGQSPPDNVPTTQQERAWSSPIWTRPIQQ